MLAFENRFYRVMDRFYGFFIRLGSNLQSIFLLYMRVMWGHQLFLHGMEKLNHKETIIQFFSTLNVPHSEFLAITVATLEVLCGVCLFAGFISRIAAIPVIFIMISALSLAHSDALLGWRFLLEPQLLVRQAPYPFLITAILVLIFGPGRVSVDAWLKRWASRQPKY